MTLPVKVLSEFLASGLSVRDASRVAICCRALRSATESTVSGQRHSDWSQLAALPFMPAEVLSSIASFLSWRDEDNMAILSHRLRSATEPTVDGQLYSVWAQFRGWAGRAGWDGLSIGAAWSQTQLHAFLNRGPAVSVVSRLLDDDDNVQMAAFEAFRGLPMSTRAAHGGSIAAIALSDDRPYFYCEELFDLLPESVIREHETAIAALLHDTSADPRLRLSVFYALDRFDSEKYIPHFIKVLAEPDDGNYDSADECPWYNAFEILYAKEPAVLEKHSDALLAMVHVSPAARVPRADAALQARGHRRRAGRVQRERAARQLESIERENDRVAGVRICAKNLLAKFMPDFAEFA